MRDTDKIAMRQLAWFDFCLTTTIRKSTSRPDCEVAVRESGPFDLDHG
jgi:hypothetical protein